MERSRCVETVKEIIRKHPDSKFNLEDLSNDEIICLIEEMEYFNIMNRVPSAVLKVYLKHNRGIDLP